MDIMRQLTRRRHVDRLHHPQAARGPGGRRHASRSSAAARSSARPTPTPGHRARLADGRPRGRARPCDKDAAEARRRQPSVTRPDGASTTTGQRAVDDVELRRPRRRDPRGRRRAGQRPDRADRGDPGPAATTSAARSSSTARNSSGRGVTQILDAGVGFVPEDRRRRPGRRLHHRREPDAGPATTAPRSPAAWHLKPGRDRRIAPKKVAEFDVRAQSAQTPMAGRSPAATSRRSCWPASSPATLKLLVAAQPTRGVDVGSIEFMHKPHRGRTRLRHPGAHRLHRARRGRRARRPDRRDVPRANVGIVPGDTPPRRAGPDDGRRASAEEALAQSRGRPPKRMSTETAAGDPAGTAPALSTTIAAGAGATARADRDPATSSSRCPGRRPRAARRRAS